MFIGHYSASFAAKRLVPRFTQTNPLDLYYMPYTHSLPAALLWPIGAGLLVFAVGKTRWGSAARRVAVAVALVVASHWVLDRLMHKPDLGLWGDHYKVGLGLWDYLWPALGLEMACFAGAAWYLRGDAKVWQAAGGKGLGIFLGVMVLIHLGNLFGPHPPSVDALVIAALAGYLIFAAVAAWLEKRGSPGVQ